MGETLVLVQLSVNLVYQLNTKYTILLFHFWFTLQLNTINHLYVVICSHLLAPGLDLSGTTTDLLLLFGTNWDKWIFWDTYVTVACYPQVECTGPVWFALLVLGRNLNIVL